jgi:hypothetical protein
VTAADGLDLGQRGVVLLEEHVFQVRQLRRGVDDVLDGQHAGADLGKAAGVGHTGFSCSRRYVGEISDASERIAMRANSSKSVQVVRRAFDWARIALIRQRSVVQVHSPFGGVDWWSVECPDLTTIYDHHLSSECVRQST